MTLSQMKNSSTKSRSRANRSGTRSYATSERAASRTIVSSVWRAGVAESTQLYTSSAMVRATPSTGKKGTRRPFTVSQRKNRLASELEESTAASVDGQTARVSSPPPTMRRGNASHSTIVPLGRSINNPTPAKVVTRATRIIVRRRRCNAATQRMSSMTVEFDRAFGSV